MRYLYINTGCILSMNANLQELLSQLVKRNGKNWKELLKNPEYYACIARIRGQVGNNLWLSSSAETDAFDLQSFRSVRPKYMTGHCSHFVFMTKAPCSESKVEMSGILFCQL